MRHGNRNKIFQRQYNERKALFNSLARAVIINEKITTTAKKAKEAVKVIDKLITLGKKNDLHSRRLAFKVLQDRMLIKRLFDDIAPRFKTRNGGYTRVMLGGFRKGDGAQMAILELVELKKKEKKAKDAKDKKSEKKEEKPKEELKKVEKKTKEEVKTEKKEEKSEVAPPPPKHAQSKKEPEPKKKILGGFKKFFKKERDSL